MVQFWGCSLGIPYQKFPFSVLLTKLGGKGWCKQVTLAQDSSKGKKSWFSSSYDGEMLHGLSILPQRQSQGTTLVVHWNFSSGACRPLLWILVFGWYRRSPKSPRKLSWVRIDRIPTLVTIKARIKESHLARNSENITPIIKSPEFGVM